MHAVTAIVALKGTASLASIGPYACDDWIAYFGLQEELAALRAQAPPAETDEAIAELRKRIAKYRYYLEQTPKPSDQAANSRPEPDWTPEKKPWNLLLPPDDVTAIEERLAKEFDLDDDKPRLDAVIVRANVSKQLRAEGSPLRQALENGGITDPDEQILVGELLTRYSPKSLTRIAASVGEIEATTRIMRMPATAALRIYRESNYGEKVVNVNQQAVVRAVELLAQRRLFRPADDIASELFKLSKSESTPGPTFAQVLMTFLRLTDPLAEVVDLTSARRFATGH